MSLSRPQQAATTLAQYIALQYLRHTTRVARTQQTRELFIRPFAEVIKPGYLHTFRRAFNETVDAQLAAAVGVGSGQKESTDE